MTHLWEVDHDYYCNLGNYYSHGCGAEYKSISAFIEAEGGCDLVYNLVFRWDWREGEDWGLGEYAGDDNYRNGRLEVFFMSQRKGAYRFATVEVCRADEAAVRAYLTPRLQHLRGLWEPLSSEVPPSSPSEVSAGTPPPDDPLQPPMGDGAL
jgi:hypothetical protein